VVSLSVRQLVKLRRIGNPPLGAAADCLRIDTRISRRINNPPQVSNLPHMQVGNLPHMQVSNLPHMQVSNLPHIPT
jgi:hypothetical protein